MNRAWALGAALACAACVPRAELTPATLDALRNSRQAFLAGEIIGLSLVAILDDRDFAYAIDYSRTTNVVTFSHLGERDFRLGLWTLGPPVQRIADARVNPNEFDVEGVAMSPDGRSAAAVSRDGWLRVFSREGNPGFTFHGSEALVSVAWDPGGRYVLVGSAKGLVTAVSPEGALLSEVRVHQDEVRGLAFAMNGVAFSGSWDRTVAILDWTKTRPLQLQVARRIVLDAFVNDLTADARGDFLGVALGDAKAERSMEVYRSEKRGVVEPVREANAGALLSTAAGAVFARYPRHHGTVASASVSPDGLSLATGGWDGKVYVFTYGAPNNPVAELSFGWAVRKVRFSSDGQFLMVASWTPVLPSATAHSQPSAAIYRVDYRSGVELREASGPSSD